MVYFVSRDGIVLSYAVLSAAPPAIPTALVTDVFEGHVYEQEGVT
jgi:hypothetical protein